MDFWRWFSAKEDRGTLQTYEEVVCKISEETLREKCPYLEFLWCAFSRIRKGPYPFKFFKGYLPQILLGSFLNTLSHIFRKNNQRFSKKNADRFSINLLRNFLQK